MSPAERELLIFLTMYIREEHLGADDWSMRPSKAEIRQRLDDILKRLQAEEAAKDPS